MLSVKSHLAAASYIIPSTKLRSGFPVTTECRMLSIGDVDQAFIRVCQYCKVLEGRGKKAEREALQLSSIALSSRPWLFAMGTFVLLLLV